MTVYSIVIKFVLIHYFILLKNTYFIRQQNITSGSKSGFCHNLPDRARTYSNFCKVVRLDHMTQRKRIKRDLVRTQ